MYCVFANTNKCNHLSKFESMDTALAHWQTLVDNGDYDIVSLRYKKNPRSTSISRSQDGEYRVKLYIDNVYQLDCDYFTDDKADAYATAERMEQDAGIS